MKLSVIIPIYNVEETIGRCLLSVLSQDVEDMEIILVDDGSQDGSSDIAKRLASENDNVKYIRQENKGLSAARNTGIKLSTGDYITFVDSDDYLLENTYAPLMQILDERKDCDILEYSLIKSQSGKEKQLLLPQATYNEPKSYWLEGKAYAHTYACNKIFKREMFAIDTAEPMLFREGIVFEDAEFLGRLLQRNPLVSTTSHIGYVYKWNPEGITSLADGQKLAFLLETNLNVARTFNCEFMRPNATGNYVKPEETALYLSLLNMQISVYRRLRTKVILPDCKVKLCNVEGFIMKLKAIYLNCFGLSKLCRILR